MTNIKLNKTMPTLFRLKSPPCASIERFDYLSTLNLTIADEVSFLCLVSLGEHLSNTRIISRLR